MNRLLHTQFRAMCRVIDMLCINFGDTIKSETITINDRIISRSVTPAFSLHLQTQWRFISEDRILLGSRDIYSPFDENHVDEEWDYVIVGRPDHESIIFDVTARQIQDELNGHYVTQCDVSPFGDIRITFSNGYVFEAFIPASHKEEEWRLIDMRTGEHLVFYDTD